MKYLLLALGLIGTHCFAQLQGISIKRAQGKIQLDAELNEPDWSSAEAASNFQQYFPSDTAHSNVKTEVKLTYDEHFIYVGAVIRSVAGRGYITPSLRRDFRGEANDGISVVFDTFKDRTNAFLFGVNPFGVQREGLIANGGSDGGEDFTLNWDNKWYSQTKIHDDHWIAEMAIPFKSIRFKENLDSWFINFYIIDSHFAERSTWARINRNYDIVSLAFNRELKWDNPLPHPGPNVSLIPYITAGTEKDFEKGLPSHNNLQIGGDAKIAISPALNMDLTVNPDFSQVEVDQQVTNLDRFEIFFPERRQFFLENADLFANFGVDGTRPFFSRRIGVTRSITTGQNIQNTIYGGLRLSGKVNNNTRIGLLNMQTGEDAENDLPSTNYTVATFQHKVFARSNFAVVAMNKQAFQNGINGDFTLSPENYNRLIGVDYNLASKSNVWNGKAFYHHSFQPNNPDSAYAYGGYLNYNTLRWNVGFFTRNVGKNFNPEVGFVRRRDIRQFASTSWYNFYPKKGKIQSHGPGFDQDLVYNTSITNPTDGIANFLNTSFNMGVLDYDINFMYRIKWKNTSSFNVRLRKEYTYLFSSFDPSGSGGLALPAGTEYSPLLIVAEYISDARKKLFYNLATRSGQYFNGTRANISGSLSYRYQPLGFASLNFSYNRINLPKPYNSADLFLIGPRIDLTFTRNLFWTTFVQYNSQIDNLNINSRLQWRFKPVSDFFLVYTDNYFAETNYRGDWIYLGRPKLRALVIKFTYWLNL